MILLTSQVLLSLLVLYALLAGVYQFVLAACHFVVKHRRGDDSGKRNRFAILVPAHDEELLISKLCDNLVAVDYPRHLFEIFIVADNCTDRTAGICGAYPVKVLERHDERKRGKGYALEWALERVRIEEFDALLVVDADTTVKPDILTELNRMLNAGEEAIQCYIEVPNRAETWFTELIHLSRTINDLLFHDSKYRLGLSSYLMGSGMCFSSNLIRKQKWTAYTLSEDWEYYAKLIEDGYKVAFAANAVVFQQESSTLKQATTQRLRWASGRFYVVRNLGIRLFFKGLRRRNATMADAALALLFPNWSLQINLLVVTLLASLLLPASGFKTAVLCIDVGLLALQALIVIAGIALSRSSWATLKAVLVAPVFLVWKLAIDVLCLTGLYRGKTWIRTKRHVPNAP